MSASYWTSLDRSLFQATFLGGVCCLMNMFCLSFVQSIEHGSPISGLWVILFGPHVFWAKKDWNSVCQILCMFGGLAINLQCKNYLTMLWPPTLPLKETGDPLHGGHWEAGISVSKTTEHTLYVMSLLFLSTPYIPSVPLKRETKEGKLCQSTVECQNMRGMGNIIFWGKGVQYQSERMKR